MLITPYCVYRLALPRSYPRLDASLPGGVAESIAKETIQTLISLSCGPRGILYDGKSRSANRTLLYTHCDARTKVCPLSERAVLPPHVRFMRVRRARNDSGDVPLIVPAQPSAQPAMARILNLKLAHASGSSINTTTIKAE